MNSHSHLDLVTRTAPGSGGEAQVRLTAQELAPLTRVVDWRSALAVLQTWLIIATTVAIALAFPSTLALLAVVVVIATQQHALFILQHEAVHYRLFADRGWNDLIGRVCGAAVGMSMRTYRILHRLHHDHLQDEKDPDIAIHGGYPRGKWYLVRKLLKDLSGRTAVNGYRYFFGSPARNARAQNAADPLAGASPQMRAAAKADQKVVIGLQLVLPLVAFSLGGWNALLLYLVLWVLPAVTLLQAILRLRAICEHGALADPVSPLNASRSHPHRLRLSALLARLFLFPHHVNYHVEHHLYPAVPHYHLAKLRELLVDRGLVSGSAAGQIDATLRIVFADPAPRAARG